MDKKTTTKEKVKFTHLHVHTHYSLLDGLGKIDDMLDRAKELGMDSLAITDHGTMYGVPEFYEKALKKSIKPIIGCEMYLAPNGMENKRAKIDEERPHLTLLAKNNVGYKNLMKLVSEAHLRGYYYKPRIDLETLKKYSEGLIGLSSCVQGEIAQLVLSKKMDSAEKRALEYQEIFGKDHYYLEIQHLPNLEKQTIANAGLIKISKKTGIPLVATADIHYVYPDDDQVQDILICIQTNRKVEETSRMSTKDNALYIKSPEEMSENFKETPQAIENTQKIANMCDVKIEFGNTILPSFEVPKGETPDSYLKKLCQNGLKKRYKESQISNEHLHRLDYELEIISKMGFASYFLIVQDFVNWAKMQGIVVGPGRGSAAGSFVSYLTGITNLDPIKYKLMFERFLNPDRISMPDVDADFADHRRDEVIQYCRKKYGEDHVAQIITFGTMAARAAVRDAGRALGIEYAYCDKLAKMIPAFTDLKSALEETKELKDEYHSNANAKKIIDSALRLEGVARHASVHACGVVITDKPVVEYAPLQLMTSRGSGKEEAIVTQYAASSKSSYVEKIGLLKMDFLGLRNLTIIENTLKIVHKTTGDFIDIEKIPLDDKETFKLLQLADTTGVFQLESSGMKRYLRQLKPTVFEDIIAMVALYRPGPMEWIPDFIAGKHGHKKITYLHPDLENVLKDTYGVAVYQEQVMEIAKVIAGFSGGEADTLRKVMGKKIVEMIAEQKQKFIDSAYQKKSVPKELAEKIFSFIEPFAGYGFNRSHAACYALIGYQTAYLKTHYPAQFMAALHNSDKDDTDRIAIEIDESRGMGIEVLPPDVNESFRDFTVILPKTKKGSPKIRFGLEAIKGVGKHIAETIIKERKAKGFFNDILSLVERVNDKDLNKKSLEALAMSGALDGIIERGTFLANVEIILNYAKSFQKNSLSGQTSLFSLGNENQKSIAPPKIKLKEAEPSTRKQRLSWEKQLLGLYISDHPLRGYGDYFKIKATPIVNLSSGQINQIVTVGGIIEKVQKINTRKGQLMYFVTIEDNLGKIEILVFPKIAEKDPTLWKEENIVLIEGKLSNKDDQLKILCEEVKKVDQEELEKYKNQEETNERCFTRKNFERQAGFTKNQGGIKKELTIFLDYNSDAKLLRTVEKILCKAESGSYQIYFSFSGKKLKIPKTISEDSPFIAELEGLLGKDKLFFDEKIEL